MFSVYKLFGKKDNARSRQWTYSSALECGVDEISRFLGATPEASAEGKIVTFRLRETDWNVELILQISHGIVSVNIWGSPSDRPLSVRVKCRQAQIKPDHENDREYLWFGTTPGYTNTGGGGFLTIEKSPALRILASASLPGVPHALVFDWGPQDYDMR